MYTLLFVFVGLMLGLSAVYYRPQAAEAALAWVIKWRRRIFAVGLLLSVVIAFQTGSPVFMLYGAVVLSGIIIWLFTRGPLEGSL